MSGTIQRIGVRIMPRNEVLDTQGRAVADMLRHHGRNLQECRVGKYVVLEIPADKPATALAQAKEMAEFVLHNPLIENFELEVLERK